MFPTQGSTALHDVLQIREKFVCEDSQGKHHKRTEAEGYEIVVLHLPDAAAL